MTFETQPLKRIDEFPQSTDDILPSQTFLSCLPLTLHHSAFDEVHEHSHACLQMAPRNFIQLYYIPLLHKWLSILIHDCIDSQMQYYKNT